MPLGLLRALSGMYGRLRDEEMLRMIVAVNAATVMTQDARARLVSSLTGEKPARGNLADLAASGMIKVTEV